jgi:hypothetical protein
MDTKEELEKLMANPPEEKPPVEAKDSASLLIIKELITKFPEIVNQIKDVKKTVPTVHPIQEGLEDAVRDLSKKLTLQIMNDSPELMSNLRIMIEDGLAQSLTPQGEEEETNGS